MECNEAMDLIPREALEPLMNEYAKTQRKLKEAKSHRRRQQLKRELNNLKIDLGWTLMDCENMKKGWPSTVCFHGPPMERLSAMAWPGLLQG